MKRCVVLVEERRWVCIGYDESLLFQVAFRFGEKLLDGRGRRWLQSLLQATLDRIGVKC